MRNYIALAIPFFFLLIGLEVWAARRRGVRVHRFNDAVVDLACGMTQQVALVFFAAALAGAYAWTYGHQRLVTFAPGSPWPWLLAFVAVDLTYYWWHRLSHEVNVLWAVHVVHHQSEDYNLAVALRQAVASTVTILPFHLPIALLGVPTVVFLTVESFSTLYQFWIHTELVGKLGPLERVVNTPSLHRVHHATNPRYLDRNYGATLIVWDRLFGTYEEERERPVYGLTKPLARFDPLWAQVHYWLELAHLSCVAARPLDKVKVWLAHPGWRPPGAAEGPQPSPAVREHAKYDPPAPRGLVAYVAANLVLAVAATFALLLFQHDLSLAKRAAVAGLVLLTLAGWGALFERRRWAFALEVGRLGLAAAVGVVWLRGSVPLPLLVGGVGAAVAVMLFWVRRLRPVAGGGAAHLA
jgi:alkylglycerol monooxygenase